MADLQHFTSVKISNISKTTTFEQLSKTIVIPNSLNNRIKINYPCFYGTNQQKGYAFVTCSNEESAQYILKHFNKKIIDGKEWDVIPDVGLQTKTEIALRGLADQLLLPGREKYIPNVDWSKFQTVSQANEIQEFSQNKQAFLLVCTTRTSYLIRKLACSLLKQKQKNENQIILMINECMEDSSVIEQYKVVSIPCLIILLNGEEKQRGYVDKLMKFK